MLTDIKIKSAKGQDKQYKVTDGQGLYLLVTPSGGKLWRMKYRFGGKEKVLAFGSYPEITLAEAREKRDEARKQVAHGIDPGEVRKAQKAAQGSTENSFEFVAREWHQKFSPRWTPVLADTILRRLERDASQLSSEITQEVLKTIELLLSAKEKDKQLSTLKNTEPQTALNALPQFGLLRLWQILGDRRKGIPPIIPVSKSSWWAGVKSGKYPKPVKLSDRCSCWRVEDIRQLVDRMKKSQNSKTDGHKEV